MYTTKINTMTEEDLKQRIMACKDARDQTFDVVAKLQSELNRTSKVLQVQEEQLFWLLQIQTELDSVSAPIHGVCTIDIKLRDMAMKRLNYEDFSVSAKRVAEIMSDAGKTLGNYLSVASANDLELKQSDIESFLHFFNSREKKTLPTTQEEMQIARLVTSPLDYHYVIAFMLHYSIVPRSIKFIIPITTPNSTSPYFDDDEYFLKEMMVLSIRPMHQTLEEGTQLFVKVVDRNGEFASFSLDQSSICVVFTMEEEESEMPFVQLLAYMRAD